MPGLSGGRRDERRRGDSTALDRRQLLRDLSVSRIADSVVWRRAAILVALCAGLAAMASSETLHDALMGLLGGIETLIVRHGMAGAVLFVSFAAVSAVFAFVSIAVIVPAAVFAWGAPLSMVLLWVGWILGGCVTYGIGRFLGPRVVRWLTINQTLHHFERRVRRDAPLGLVLLFQLALPSEIPGYVLGLTRYRFRKYLLALAIAELPYTVLTIYLGASFIERRSGMILAAGIALLALSLGAFYIWRARMRAEKPTSRLQ
jgi:uncharacterized membrane protein YdjX (TVP38/TMEM64 family)